MKLACGSQDSWTARFRHKAQKMSIRGIIALLMGRRVWSNRLRCRSAWSGARIEARRLEAGAIWTGDLGYVDPGLGGALPWDQQEGATNMRGHSAGEGKSLRASMYLEARYL